MRGDPRRRTPTTSLGAALRVHLIGTAIECENANRPPRSTLSTVAPTSTTTVGDFAGFGKRIGSDVYLHVSALAALQHIAGESVLARLRAELERQPVPFNVVKLNIKTGKASFLHYACYFDDPFPALIRSYSFALTNGQGRWRSYEHSTNPPILHRKELLLAPDHPAVPTFAALTAALDEAGLLGTGNNIGYRRQWEDRLQSAGYRVEGHSLVQETSADESAEAPLPVERHRTAMTRYALSAPFQALARYGLLARGWRIFDYGCGKGDDVSILRRNGLDARGWDPFYLPTAPKKRADIVNLGYVVNVIEKPAERVEALEQSYALCRRLLSVAAMLQTAAPEDALPYEDGVLSRRNTFQKYYTQEELREFIHGVLGEEPIAIAPGLHFVFKDKDEEQRFLESRQSSRTHLDKLISRIPKPTRAEKERELYGRHVDLLAPLWDSWLTLGRRPSAEEFQRADEVVAVFGSFNSALRFLERYHGDEAIALARASRKEDLRVYFALREFEPKRKYRHLPDYLKRDLRCLFGSYKALRQEARALLFATGERERLAALCEEVADKGLGALDAEGCLYILSARLGDLPPALRVYVGCASVLYGDLSNVDLIKIHPYTSKLTVCRFDHFDDIPLPRMKERVKIDLAHQRVDVFTYGEMYEEPYLYLKSRFMTPEDPRFREQQEFDEALEALGVFDFSGYGPTPAAFHERLCQLRKRIDGYELVDEPEVPNLDEKCGQYLTYRDVLLCSARGEQAPSHEVLQDPALYSAVAGLVQAVIDPVMDYFGGIEIREWQAVDIAHDVSRGTDSPTDRRRTGSCRIAIEFIVPDEDMLEVARWIPENTLCKQVQCFGDANPLRVKLGGEYGPVEEAAAPYSDQSS